MDSNCLTFTQRRLSSPWAALPWRALSPDSIPRGGRPCSSPWKPFVRSNEMIRPKDVFSEAYVSLRFNRQRSALTMLGMAWGIATVVLLLAYGAGFERAIMTVFSSVGLHMIVVFPG